MAAEGLTNKEIGHALYLSHRTVGSHLYRTFPKLGIASRSQLASVLVGAEARSPASAVAGTGPPDAKSAADSNRN
jgi:hypothetical protein